MSEKRYHLIPVILVVLSVLIVWGTAYTASDHIGHLQWLLYSAGLLALSGVFWFRRELSADELSLEADRQALKTEKAEFRQVRGEFEKELERRSQHLGKRESDLSQKLATFHEWMEFPTGIEGPAGARPIMPDADFQKSDQAVLELIQKRTEQIFNKIREKDYLESGVFQHDRLFKDLLDLVESVARIYNPDSAHPLLETSVEQLLRAINRIALQLLVVLEQLPLDLKTYNFKKVYEAVQAGVRVYGVYKAVDPYWTYLRPVYYLGRFTLGANPITLGVGWALGELAKTGARKLSSHLANRYALSLLYDMVFIIGSESAGIFGGDFRHREANWIYGAELTEMIRRLPVSREVLAQGLNEVGQLRLRNEYDRIFLYRCLTACKSAGPQKFDARAFLSAQDRNRVAERLERFLRRHIHGKADDLDAWKSEVEERLEVRFRSDTPKISNASDDNAADGLRSLASFLLDFKKQAPGDLPVLLAETRLLARLSDAQQQETMRRLTDEPPMIFDYPDLDPDDKLLDDYLRDLTTLCVRVFPYTVQGDYIVESVAQYFRREARELRKQMEKLYSGFLAEKLLPDSPEKKLKPRVARSLLAALEAGEKPGFVYQDVRPETVEDESLPKGRMWLMGTDRRLLLILVPEQEKTPSEPVLLWQCGRSGDERPSVERVEKRFTSDCRLSGGTWLSAENRGDGSRPALILSGQTMSRYETYFKALTDFLA